MTKSTIGIAMIIAALAASPAVADPSETVSGTVSIAGLDLTNPAHQATLQKRIRRVAWDICHPNGQSLMSEFDDELDARRCVKQAIGSAQPQVDRAVTLAFARKQGTDRFALASRR